MKWKSDYTVWTFMSLIIAAFAWIVIRTRGGTDDTSLSMWKISMPLIFAGGLTWIIGSVTEEGEW